MKRRKLKLNKETLATLTPRELERAQGAYQRGGGSGFQTLCGTCKTCFTDCTCLISICPCNYP